MPESRSQSNPARANANKIMKPSAHRHNCDSSRSKLLGGREEPVGRSGFKDMRRADSSWSYDTESGRTTRRVLVNRVLENLVRLGTGEPSSCSNLGNAAISTASDVTFITAQSLSHFLKSPLGRVVVSLEKSCRGFRFNKRNEICSIKRSAPRFTESMPTSFRWKSIARASSAIR